MGTQTGVVKGVWVFNETLTAPASNIYQDVNFVSGQHSLCSINITTEPCMDYYSSDITIHAYGSDSGFWGEWQRTIDFGDTEQTVSHNFYTWLTANAVCLCAEEEPTVASIRYNGATIASLLAGQKAALSCGGMKMASDVVVEISDDISLSCDKPHVVEVDELPTENIDTKAVYSCGGKYYKYSDKFLDVIIYNSEDGRMSINEILRLAGFEHSCNIIPKKTTAGVSVSQINGDNSICHFYYIEEEKDIFLYTYDEETNEYGWHLLFTEWDGVTNGGTIFDISEANGEDCYYALMETGWVEYVHSNGYLKITENGTYDVRDKANVAVDLPTEAIAGSWKFNVTTTENGTKEIALTSNLPQYAEATVNFECIYNGETRVMTKISVWTYDRSGSYGLDFCDADDNCITAASGNTGNTAMWNEALCETINFGENPQVIPEWLKTLMGEIAQDATPDYIGFFDGTISGEVTVPAHITKLRRGAFYDCASMKRIFIHDKVTAVGDSCFFACFELEECILPAGVKSIGSQTFFMNRELRKLDCWITQLKGSGCFQRCDILQMLIIRSSTMCTLEGAYSFTNSAIVNGTGYIYVPRALVDRYKSATNWSTYANQFRALEDYTVDGTTTGAIDETKI